MLFRSHQCYARLSYVGERLAAFHLRLDAPTDGDTAIGATLAACSAVTYGRDIAAVAADRATLLQQIDVPEGEPAAEGHTGRAKLDPENGRLPPVSAGSVGSAAAAGKRRRNEGRGRKRPAEVRPTQQPLGLEVDSAGSSLAADHEQRDEGLG